MRSALFYYAVQVRLSNSSELLRDFDKNTLSNSLISAFNLAVQGMLALFSEAGDIIKRDYLNPDTFESMHQ